MKTSVRWRTNRSAFSSSLFAHGLGGVEVLRIGGLGCVGFVRVLIEFQREWSEDFNLDTQSVKVSFLNLYYLTLGSVDEERIDIGEFIPGSWRAEVTQMRTIARPVSGYKSSELAREF